ncbi:MAG: PAS domain S-box protein [Syntrophotaleaceae bacterium]
MDCLDKDPLIHHLIGSIPDFIAVIDRDFRVVVCNWGGGYDYVPSEKRAGEIICYKTFRSDQSGPCRDCCAEEVFQTGEPCIRETVHPLIGHQEMRCSPLLDQDGNITRVMVQICEINAKKQAEKALLDSEAGYRMLVESQVDPICRWRPDGTLTFVNEAYCRFMGKSRDQLLGSRIPDLLSQADRRSFEDHMTSLIAEPRIAQFEQKIVTCDEGYRWFIWSDRPISDDDGELLEFQSVARDVTTIRLALENLRQSEERFREVFENDLTANLVATVNGQVVDCNTAYVRLFGFSSVEQARSMCALHLFQSQESASKLMDFIRREKRLENYEWETKRLDGTPLSLIANVIGVFDDEGELTYLRAFLFDNTELKNLQKQFLHAQKMEAMGRLAGGVAHDFNNLLTIISGYGEYLLQETSDGNMQTCLEQICRAADQAAALTSQLLTFSRRQVCQATEINLNTLAADLQDMLKRTLPADIELLVISDPRLGFVRADYGQMEQVLLNLAVNARDAMPNGGRLTIETVNIEFGENSSSWPAGLKPGGYVMLSVSDNGIGMDSETMSHIFEPFFTTKESGKGTGLGLSTVYGIVQQSEGQVFVCSTPGVGTTFRIYLPRIEDVDQSARIESAPPQAAMGAGTVLLVEDNDVVRELTHLVLQGGGYSVLQAQNAEEAVNIFEQRPDEIDVLLTDIVMPGRSGVSLAAELRRLKPDLKVLLVSGYPKDAFEDQSILDSGAHFLQKPFSPFSLSQKVREVLSGV